MTTVAVLGGGAGGVAAVADLAQAGHSVRLWNRRESTLAPLREHGVRYMGVLGEGRVEPPLITTDLAAALDGVEVAVVCLPAVAHGALADDLGGLDPRVPIVLNPGHTGGALHLHSTLMAWGRRPPPLAELSTLTYVARRMDDGTVRISGKAGHVHAACLPGGTPALELALELFPAATPVADVLATGLSNVNLVLHPPGAILGAAWVEATAGDFTFYVEGMTPGVVRVLSQLDQERLAVARAYGHRLPDLLQEMAAIGTADRAAAERGDTAAAIRGGAANASIKAPDSLAHRYYREDLGHGLLPMREFAELVGVDVPVTRALLALGSTATGHDIEAEGLTLARMGLAGLDRDGVLTTIRSGRTIDRSPR